MNRFLKATTDVERAEYDRLFKIFDADGNGEITSEEFQEAAKRLQMNLGAKQMKILLAKVDVDNSGTLDFDEFVTMLQMHKEGQKICAAATAGNLDAEVPALKDLDKSEVQEYRYLFTVFDKDGDGDITTEELKIAMAANGMQVSDKELKILLESVDEDNSGTIDFPEFVKMMVLFKKGGAAVILSSDDEDSDSSSSEEDVKTAVLTRQSTSRLQRGKSTLSRRSRRSPRLVTKKASQYVEDMNNKEINQIPKLLQNLQKVLARAEESWITDFCSNSNGLSAISSLINLAMENRKKQVKTFYSTETLKVAFDVLDVIAETTAGNEALVKADLLFDSLFQTLLLQDPYITSKALTVLALIINLPEGHEAIMSRFQSFAKEFCDSNAFSFILGLLQNDPTVEELVAGMAFINSVTCMPGEVDDRDKIRKKWIAAGIHDWVELLKDSWVLSSPSLEAAVEVWEEEAIEDDRVKAALSNTDNSGGQLSPEEVFGMLQEVSQTPKSKEAFGKALEMLAYIVASNPKEVGDMWDLIRKVLEKLYSLLSFGDEVSNVEVMSDKAFHRLHQDHQNEMNALSRRLREQKATVKDLNGEIRRLKQQMKANIRNSLIQRLSSAAKAQSATNNDATAGQGAPPSTPTEVPPSTGGPPPPSGGPPAPGGGPPPPSGGPPAPGGGPPPPSGGPPAPGGGPPPPSGGPPAPGGGPPPPSGGPPAPGGGPPAPGGGPPAPGGGPPAPGGGPPAPGGGAPGGAKSTVRKPSCKMKTVNWTKFTPPPNSVWTIKPAEEKKEIALDYADIENCFKRKVFVKKEVKEEKKPTFISIVDQKVANNCSIMLASKFRKVSLDKIKDWILELNRDKIGSTIEMLVQYIPTDDQAQQIRSCPTPDLLGKCEQYYLKILEIPRFGTRLTTFKYTFEFNDWIEDIEPQVSSILSACEEVRSSSKFHGLLEIVLALGNFINGGGFRGNAAGFRISSLNALADTKTTDNRSNLVQYIVKYVRDKFPELVDWADELSHISPAASANLAMMQANLAKLKLGFRKLEKELEIVTAVPLEKRNPNDQYIPLMSGFVTENRPKIEKLEEQFKTLETEYAATAKFFGEEAGPKNPPEEFFGMFRTFMTTFASAVKEIDRRIAVEERKARLAARRAENLKNAPKKKTGVGMREVVAGGFRERRSNVKKTKTGCTPRLSRGQLRAMLLGGPS